MPAPIDINPYPSSGLSGLKTAQHSAPKEDYIDFNEYPMQSVFGDCSVIDDPFCHRDVEDSFCRDFSCCGLELRDLHDLLQHYEECHVRFEADEDPSFDLYNEDRASAAGTPTRSPTSKKQRISVSLSDMYWEETASHSGEANISAFNNSVLRTGKPSSTKKKPLEPLDTTRRNALGCPPADTPPAKLAVCTQVDTSCPSALSTPLSSAPTTPSSIKSPSSVTIADLDLLAQLDPAAALFPRTSYFAVADDLSAQLEDLYSASSKSLDKPYKCTIDGCNKAYKNANGLKYHTIHGHGGLELPASKPYKCTVLECGKRYKNLNGLKYHIEHSHVLTLNG